MYTLITGTYLFTNTVYTVGNTRSYHDMYILLTVFRYTLITGTYLFTNTVHTYGDTDSYANMMMDGTVIGNEISYSSGADPTTLVVIRQCQEGSKVYIECAERQGSCAPHAYEGPGLSTFSGFLIASDT